MTQHPVDKALGFFPERRTHQIIDYGTNDCIQHGDAFDDVVQGIEVWYRLVPFFLIVIHGEVVSVVRSVAEKESHYDSDKHWNRLLLPDHHDLPVPRRDLPRWCPVRPELDGDTEVDEPHGVDGNQELGQRDEDSVPFSSIDVGPTFEAHTDRSTLAVDGWW